MEQLLVKRDGGLLTVTLNAPDKGNALNEPLKVALRDTLVAAATDETVRAVVLTGNGKTFCVGQDLGEHAAALEKGGPELAFATVGEHYNPIVTALATMPKPVIAAINGTCVGAGLGFALACDIRIAAEEAKFGTAFIGIGLTGDSGLSATLARAVGMARASELMMLAEPFGAAQALEWGIVGKVVPAAELAATTQKTAARLAAGPTAAYAMIKRSLHGAWGADLESALAAEGTGQREVGSTADHTGAVTAFLSKQRPTFTGR